jgi:TPR repeat protein
MRELAAVYFQGHAEAKVEQNKTLAESYWSKAAESGDLWSAWHATLSYLRDGEIDAAVPYLDIVSNSTFMPLKFMALHFK